MQYVITIRGHLDDHWSGWFDGLTITNTPDGETTLAGPIVDQAALHGVLAKIRDLGLPLIAIAPLHVPDLSADHAGGLPVDMHEQRSATTDG